NVGAHYYQWRYGTKQPTIVDPTTTPNPIQPGNVLNGKYNLLPSDVSDGFRFQLDGEASNGFVARNDTDQNYTTYLRQWQRLTGYRRVFYRNEVNSQVSGLQSMVSVFRNADGALAELTYDRDRKRAQPNVTVMEGYYGTNSYLVIDRSNSTTATLYSLVWQQANTLNSIDLTSPPRVGPTPADAVDLAGKVSHRIALDITTS